MSHARDVPDDATATLRASLEPRPLTGQTVTVTVDRESLTLALAALDALAAADRPSQTGRATVAAVRARVRTRLDWLAAGPDDTLLVRFDAADVVLLALALVARAREHRADRERRFLQAARDWLGHLGAQRPALVDALTRVE